MRLLTLGRLELRTAEGSAVPAVLSQKKRVALLCYLAVREPGSFVQRHAVGALFWPESTEARARGALRNALHYLRTALGADAIITRGDEEIALDPRVLWCDAAEMEALVRAGRLEEALQLYRGPLLEGMLPRELPEFCEWLEQRRRAYHWMARDAARALAENASEESPSAAVPWTQRWLELAPYDEPAIRALVHVQLASGNRGAALDAFDEWAARLERDLAAQPSAETLRLMAAVRATPAPAVASSQNPPEAALTAPSPEPSRSEMPVAPARRRRRLPALVAGPLLALAAAAVFMLRGPDASPLDADDAGTESTAAAEAFAQGRAAYLSGQYHAAADAFQRAVVLDSTYARAHLALSFAADWTGRSGLQRSSIQRARQYATQLSQTDRLMLDAWDHHIGHNPDPVAADSMYRAVLAREPDNAEAWYQLGEVRYHWGGTYGMTVDAAVPAFERTLALMPQHAGALIHLLRLRARTVDSSAVAALAARLASSGARAREQMEARVLVAAAAGDAERFRALLPPLWEQAGYETLLTSLLASYRFDWIADAARDLLLRDNTAQMRAFLRVAVAQLEAGRGSHRVALEEARALASVSRGRAAEITATLLVLPFAGAAERDLAAAREALRAYDAQDARVGPTVTHIADAGIYHPRMLLLRGLLSLRLRDGADVDATLARLDSLTAPTRQPELFARQYARVLRARRALDGGDAAAALSALGEPQIQAHKGFADVLSFPIVLERWTRAEALERLGRTRDALTWYEGFPDPTGADVMFTPHAHWRSALLHEELGERDAAARHYRAFVTLASPDAPEVATNVARARNALRAGGGS